MIGAGTLRRLLERLRRWRGTRRNPNLWRDLGDIFREEDRKAGRARNRETEETLRCGWSHLHPPGGNDEADAASDRRGR